MPNTKKVVIFDMDKTLLACDSMALWHQFLEERGFITEQDKQTRKRLHEEYVAGSLDIHENFRFEFSLLNKIPNDQKIALQNYFFEHYLKPEISSKALELIANYRKEGAVILLSTSSMSFIAAPVAAFIQADHLLATEGCVSNNQYTGQINGVPNYQEGKRTNFLNWQRDNSVNRSQTVFYTDSINDLDLLEVVGVPVAVNPDAKLYQHAKNRGWEITEFYTVQYNEKSSKKEEQTKSHYPHFISNLSATKNPTEISSKTTLQTAGSAARSRL